MGLFERFEHEGKEEGFCEKFVKPLLIQLGFSQIAYTCGPHEFGKDVVFTEVDRFNHQRHMAVQAKHVKTINEGHAVRSLADQTRQAFLHPYELQTAQRQQRRVSAVYVFNSGAITPKAQELIRDYVDEALRPNVYFYDGDQLEVLASTAIQQRNESTVERLIVLRRQLLRNLVHWQNVMMQMNVDRDILLQVRGTMFQALDEWLIRPVGSPPIDYDNVTRLYEFATLAETLVQQFMFRPPDPPNRLEQFNGIHHTCHAAMKLAQEIVPTIDQAIRTLPATILD